MFKILAVEDDRDLNQTVCSFLNKNGFEAVGALSANDAYDKMYGTMFDLIISDIMIPGIVVGLVGIMLLSLAYPVYKRIVQKKREQIAPRILALTEELLKSE